MNILNVVISDFKIVLFFSIKLKSNSQLIGSLSVYKINWKNNSVNIGYWMAENFTRKGYTSESLEYLMKYLKEVYINKIYAFTFTNNTGSIKVLEKKGFILLKNITVGKRDASIYCLTIGRGENMELGLGKNEVRLTSHDPRWKLEFEIIKNEIIQNTDIAPDNIEHIGSTSIPGIDAKPIID